ncbi:PREDICTED: myotubularin-related protein 11, partial [Nanorana parkeri]|uniref:myotubularin-related protein 11 n=1 Tax=Nanorana parkeri TaxID=125878 RepID=UPI0008545159
SSMFSCLASSMFPCGGLRVSACRSEFHPLTSSSVSLGEDVHEESPRVRRRVYYNDGHRQVYGTLYCTSHRIAFRPDCVHPPEHSSGEAMFDNDNDIALPCVDRIVAVAGQSKVKVVTPSLSLKFVPEELLIHYRGFRLMHFHFSDNGLKTEAYTVRSHCMQEEGRILSYNSVHRKPNNQSVLRSLDRREGAAHMDYPTKLFESAKDWENEMKRLGATAWRVTPLNERCDTCTSLSKYLVVPCKLLDKDLKRTFAHFQQRRIARWSWHHPCGSDLLRAAGFQTNTDPDKEDLKSVRWLLYAHHAQCVVIDTSEDLPSIADIQISHLKLRSLCSADTSTPTPDEKWLSSLEGTRWLDHVR